MDEDLLINFHLISKAESVHIFSVYTNAYTIQLKSEPLLPNESKVRKLKLKEEKPKYVVFGFFKYN